MEYTYLYQTEDYEMFKSAIPPTQDDMDQADDGYLAIFNLQDMTEYHNGSWVPIKEYPYNKI